MRRKPSSQGSGGYNNNQQRKPRYQQGGSGGEHRSHSGHSSHNRPRKNYAAAREKYLAQARDALASGDRVLAENYFQHADHCYRMMVEEGYNNRNNYTPPPQGEQNGEHPQEQGDGNQGQNHQESHQDEMQPDNNNGLPAFLTADFEHSEHAKPAEPPVQNWEERDA